MSFKRKRADECPTTCPECGVNKHEQVSIELGVWARHRGTKGWGKVTTIIPQHDRSLEMLLEREVPFDEWEGPTASWGSHHLDTVIPHPPTKWDKLQATPWAPLGGLG